MCTERMHTEMLATESHLYPCTPDLQTSLPLHTGQPDTALRRPSARNGHASHNQVTMYPGTSAGERVDFTLFPHNVPNCFNFHQIFIVVNKVLVGLTLMSLVIKPHQDSIPK